MRALSIVFLAISAMANGQVKLSLKINGAPAGEVQTSQRLTADGGRIVELRLSVHNNRKTATVHTTSTFNASGEPVRKVQETITSEHEQRVVIATFDASGANVIVNDGSSRKATHLNLDKAAPRAETSGFWWLRDRPKPGNKVRQYAFNMDSLGWEQTETTYVGDVSLKGVKAHQVRIEVGDRVTTSYLDDQGEPLKIEAGTVLMEREE